MCGRPRCLTCKYTNDQTFFQGPDGQCVVNGSYSCITENVVYCILCKHCGQLYIGETKRKLGDRFREHRRDIIKKSDISPVAQHFCASPHALSDACVSVLVECSTDRERKNMEMRLIYKLGTLAPRGINADFTYNV